MYKHILAAVGFNKSIALAVIEPLNSPFRHVVDPLLVSFGNGGALLQSYFGTESLRRKIDFPNNPKYRTQSNSLDYYNFQPPKCKKRISPEQLQTVPSPQSLVLRPRSISLQKSFLRVIQEHVFRPVGSKEELIWRGTSVAQFPSGLRQSARLIENGAHASEGSRSPAVLEPLIVIRRGRSVKSNIVPLLVQQMTADLFLC